jgi:hypothetical protein
VTCDCSTPDAQRQIGRAEKELPVLVQQPLMGGIHELGRRRGRRHQAVIDRGESPRDVRIELGQACHQLGGELLGEVGRRSRGGDQPHHYPRPSLAFIDRWLSKPTHAASL